MNITFSTLVVIITAIVIKQFILKKASKKVVQDERTTAVGLQASRAAYIVFTLTIAITSMLLMFFGEYGMVPSAYLDSLGQVLSYLTCFILVLYMIFYNYFNKKL